MEENNHKGLFIALGVIILVVLVFFFIFYGKSGSSDGEINVSLNEIDISSVSEEEKLPEGFPKDVPVELSNIEDSYSAVYEDDGFTQNSITYTSSKTIAEIYSEYEGFMEDSGYEITDSSLASGVASLYASKDNDDLSVVIANVSGLSTVSVSYLDR